MNLKEHTKALQVLSLYLYTAIIIISSYVRTCGIILAHLLPKLYKHVEYIEGNRHCCWRHIHFVASCDGRIHVQWSYLKYPPPTDCLTMSTCIHARTHTHMHTHKHIHKLNMYTYEQITCTQIHTHLLLLQFGTNISKNVF